MSETPKLPNNAPSADAAGLDRRSFLALGSAAAVVGVAGAVVAPAAEAACGCAAEPAPGVAAAVAPTSSDNRPDLKGKWLAI